MRVNKWRRLGLPFMLSALLMDQFAAALKSLRWAGQLLQVGAGGIMILMSGAMITGRLLSFSFRLLDQSPVLIKIG
jgi:hypothetical protein